MASICESSNPRDVEIQDCVSLRVRVKKVYPGCVLSAVLLVALPLVAQGRHSAFSSLEDSERLIR